MLIIYMCAYCCLLFVIIIMYMLALIFYQHIVVSINFVLLVFLFVTIFICMFRTSLYSKIILQ